MLESDRAAVVRIRQRPRRPPPDETEHQPDPIPIFVRAAIEQDLPVQLIHGDQQVEAREVGLVNNAGPDTEVDSAARSRGNGTPVAAARRRGRHGCRPNRSRPGGAARAPGPACGRRPRQWAICRCSPLGATCFGSGAISARNRHLAGFARVSPDTEIGLEDDLGGVRWADAGSLPNSSSRRSIW